MRWVWFLCLVTAAQLLFPDTGAGANPIQTENALPGTTNWQITNPGSNREIEGYASLTSVNKGGQISLFVSTDDATYTIDIFRMGWYGGTGAREVLGPILLPGLRQVTPIPDPDTGLAECNWTASYVLAVPSTWVSCAPCMPCGPAGSA